MKKIVIGENDANQRLDKFLSKLLKTMPQSLIYRALRKKRVKRNGERAQGGERLDAGDVLELYINDEFFEKPAADDAWKNLRTARLSVVYEDENILLANKPQGLCVHPGKNGGETDTLLARVKRYLYEKGDWNPEAENAFAPALCNRLDRNTQGLALAAKNAEALRVLNEKIREREIRKLYLCLAEGTFAESEREKTLNGWLWKDAKENKVYVYDEPREGARPIETRYRVLADDGLQSLLEVELLTGRTHQIRAHLAHIGRPLAGDGKYAKLGNRKIFRQALCAYKLIFTFPTDAGVLNYLKGKVFEIEKPAFAKAFGL